MFASKTLWETFLWWSIFRAEILGGHYTLLLALSGFKSCFLFYILTYFFTIKRLLNIYFPNCSCPLQNETWRLYQRLKQSPVSKCSYSIPASLADSKCLFSLIMFKALKPTPQAHAPHPTRSASRSIIVTRNAMVARVPAHSRQTCWKQTQMTTLIENSDWKSRLLGSSLCLSDCSCSLLLPGEKKKKPRKREKGRQAKISGTGGTFRKSYVIPHQPCSPAFYSGEIFDCKSLHSILLLAEGMIAWWDGVFSGCESFLS